MDSRSGWRKTTQRRRGSTEPAADLDGTLIQSAFSVERPIEERQMALETPPVTSFNLSRWAIQHRSMTRFLFLLALLAGLFSLTQMGQKEDPDFTFRVMVVQVAWPGS
jgi:hypothetical protein